MKRTKAVFMLSMLLLITLAAGAPDEAMGRVSKVVDGDTFDVALDSHDSRITEDLIRVRLADIDTPEVRGPKACEEVIASAFCRIAKASSPTGVSPRIHADQI